MAKILIIGGNDSTVSAIEHRAGTGTPAGEPVPE